MSERAIDAPMAGDARGDSGGDSGGDGGGAGGGAPEYAQPILTKLRTLFHEAHPDVVESIKWSSPHFEHKGILGGMGAFKTHVLYGFWRAKAMKDPAGLFEGDEKQSPFAVKAMSLDDLPEDKVLISYIKQAVALNDAGDKTGPGSGFYVCFPGITLEYLTGGMSPPLAAGLQYGL